MQFEDSARVGLCITIPAQHDQVVAADSPYESEDRTVAPDEGAGFRIFTVILLS